MAALFAEGDAGEGWYHGVWVGLRIYFGQKDKTLIRRHREDDPIGDSSAEPLVNIAESLGPSARSVTGVCTSPTEVFMNGQCVSIN